MEENSEQNRAVDRTEQNRKKQSTEEGSRQKLEEADGQGKSIARTCGFRGRVGQRERTSQHCRWLYGNFARTHVRDSLQMNRKLHKSLTILHLELIQVHVYLFSFLPSSRLCMLCFVCFYRNLKYSWPEMRETTRRSDCHK